MRLTRLVLASAALIMPSAAASAQSWSTYTPNNNGAEFWDNQSTDGNYCNIGYVLNGTAGTKNKTCANQRPSNWLPYTGDKPTYYLNNGSGKAQAFTFAAGTYTFSLLPGAKFGGDIAGENTAWGYYTDANDASTRVNLGATSSELNTVGSTTVAFTDVWGLWVQLVDGSYAYSGVAGDKQFALFAFDNAGTFTGSTLNYAYDSHYIAGLEDTRNFTEAKTCLKYKTDHKGKPTSTCKEWSTPQSWKSDWDYNDIAFQITTPGKSISTVPEPSTYALMAAGLGALFMTARRRRRNG